MQPQFARQPIENQKLIYHLTAFTNLPGILQHGLVPRNQLSIRDFEDVADPEIIQFRGETDLNDCVPFHFFSKNPFDGRVQRDNPDKTFVYICLARKYARSQNFEILPMHPMALDPFVTYNYDEGLQLIDWETMNKRTYTESYGKNVCMAECIARRVIRPQEFCSIHVNDDSLRQHIANIYVGIHRTPPPFRIYTNPDWFL